LNDTDDLALNDGLIDEETAGWAEGKLAVLEHAV
jgi:hypothetical protein